MKNLLFDFISKYVPLDETEKKAIIDLNIFQTYKKGTILLKEGQSVCSQIKMNFFAQNLREVSANLVKNFDTVFF